MTIQPYYVIPILIKQPTWGGNYIITAKGVNIPQLQEEKIGQSYELSAESRVSTDPAAQDSYYVTDSSMGSGQQYGSVSSSIDLQSLISVNPEAVLGKTSYIGSSSSMPILIKFTHANNNSYQVHVKPGSEFHGWEAKPESWYFLKPGKATLGLKAGISLGQYKQDYEEIDVCARELGQQVKNQQSSMQDALLQIEQCIAERHPNRYVNTVTIPADSVVDLSSGGIHHSWESDARFPDGNIVFEVQVDVKDERSTIRSFDQGKLKENGDVRPLSIEDYFQAINTSPLDNSPEHLIKQPQGHLEGSIRHFNLFETPYYSLQKIEFLSAASKPMALTTFQHVFALDGQVRIEWGSQTFDLKEGRSLFIPAACQQYVLSTTDAATVLITQPGLELPTA